MARIRTLKPDAFRSRTMKKLSFRARWTFWGLLVQVDDKGRARDDVDLIRADIYPLEMDEVNVKDVETDLAELVGAEMVCRYRVGREDYLHIINFAKHQRINRPSESQLPECPHHGGGGGSKQEKAAPEPPFSEPSLSPHEPLTESSVSPQPSRVRAGSGMEEETEVEEEGERAAPPTLAHPEALFEFAATPPAAEDHPDSSEPEITAGSLLAEWLEYRGEDRPSERIIGRVGKHLKELLAEGINPVDVRQGFIDWEKKGADPAALPSFVNGATARRRAQTASGPRSAVAAPRPSTTTRIVDQGVELIRKMAEEDGVDLGTLIPVDFSQQRRELTA